MRSSAHHPPSCPSMLIAWYLHCLKHHPLKTNLTSSGLLMTFGDLAAQGLEQRYYSADPLLVTKPASSSESTLHRHKTIHFRQYGTLSTQNVEERSRSSPSSVDPTATSTNEGYNQSQSTLPFQVDSFRTITMSAWASCVVVPYYLWLYRQFDRYLPHGRSFSSIAPRVAGMFLSSIPLNGTFFIYGSVVHHLAEWVGLLQEHWYIHKEKLAEESTTVSEWMQLILHVPFDVPMMISTARLKLEHEWIPTVSSSAAVWIPFNTANFALIPAHLRPLSFMIFSFSWNIFLSLAQHRDETYDSVDGS